MWGHYLLGFYRSLTRRWLYAALNVLGLAVGVAVFLVLMLDVRFETGFDRWIPHADTVYRFNSTYTLPGRGPDRLATTSAAVAPAFRADYPQVLGVTRLIDSERPVANGPLLGSEHMDYVDANFFGVLDLPLAYGDARSALSDPDDVVITEAVADKYFGKTSVVGRTLTLYYHGVARDHHVSAVLRDLPANTHLKLAVVAPITPAFLSEPNSGYDQWGNVVGFTYARFHDNAQARAIGADLPSFVHRRAHDTGGPAIDISQVLHLDLTAVPDLHFADNRTRWAMKPGVDVRLVYALALVGVLTLVVAVLNYVNLATARSALRAKEIAMRKVMGATRAALMLQLLIEAVAFSAVAILIGVALAELSLPVVNALTGASLALAYWGADGVLPWLLFLALVIGLGAGFYPALLISRFEPAPVLAAARTPGGGRGEARVRAGLIGAQFVVAIAFTICTLVIGAQAQFIRDADRGFRRDGVIMLGNLGAVRLLDRQNELLNLVRRLPGVVSATASLREPGLPNEGVVTVKRPGSKGGPIALAVDLITDDYLATYGARLAAGRMFDRAHGLDDVNGHYGGTGEAAARGVDVVLNETAVRALGFASPAQAVGQSVFIGDPGAGKGGAVPVIGVLRDVQFGSPRQPVAGVVYQYNSQDFGGDAIGAVRYAGVGDAVMMDRLQAAWRSAAPDVPFLGRTAEDSLSDFYLPDQQRSRLFTIGSVLAVMIGCVGLYGLAAFNTARRFKEIGIRKTLGASTADVLKLLLIEILRPVVIANLIAWPLAWLGMRGWLSGFDQRVALSPLFFLAASVLALAVASLTVLAQSLRLAGAEPARALRHE